MKACSARTLGEVAEIVMGQSPPGASCNTEEIGIPLLNGPTEFGSYHPVPVQFTTTARKRARPGDLLFCVRGSTTGRMNWADREYAIGRGVAAIRHRLYLELQPFVRAVIEYNLPELLAQATGSTFPNVSANQLAGLWWPPLPLTEQRAIAHILGTLDDKIELNRKMNQTLEALAQTEFQRMMREGCNWKVGRLSDLCTTQYGFTASAMDEPVGPKLLRVTDINKRNWVEWDSVPHCRISAEEKRRYALSVGDIVVARMADPGKAAIVEEEIDAVFASYLVRLKTESLAHAYYVYGFLKSQEYREYSEGVMGGSVQANMNAKVIVAAELPIPPVPVMETHLKKVLPLRQRIVANLRESRTLAALRDALLPKLISGEIRVRDAERFLKERGL